MYIKNEDGIAVLKTYIQSCKQAYRLPQVLCTLKAEKGNLEVSFSGMSFFKVKALFSGIPTEVGNEFSTFIIDEENDYKLEKYSISTYNWVEVLNMLGKGIVYVSVKNDVLFIQSYDRIASFTSVNNDSLFKDSEDHFKFENTGNSLILTKDDIINVPLKMAKTTVRNLINGNQTPYGDYHLKEGLLSFMNQACIMEIDMDTGVDKPITLPVQVTDILTASTLLVEKGYDTLKAIIGENKMRIIPLSRDEDPSLFDDFSASFLFNQLQGKSIEIDFDEVRPIRFEIPYRRLLDFFEWRETIMANFESGNYDTNFHLDKNKSHITIDVTSGMEKIPLGIITCTSLELGNNESYHFSIQAKILMMALKFIQGYQEFILGILQAREETPSLSLWEPNLLFQLDTEGHKLFLDINLQGEEGDFDTSCNDVRFKACFMYNVITDKGIQEV